VCGQRPIVKRDHCGHETGGECAAARSVVVDWQGQIDGLGGLLERFFTPAIIAGGRLDVLMSHEARHHRNIDAVVEQVADEGAAQVMRGEVGQVGTLSATAQQHVDGIIRKARHVLIGAGEERAGAIATQRQPVTEHGPRAGIQVDDARLAALACVDFQPGGFRVVIGQIEGDQL